MLALTHSHTCSYWRVRASNLPQRKYLSQPRTNYTNTDILYLNWLSQAFLLMLLVVPEVTPKRNPSWTELCPFSLSKAASVSAYEIRCLLTLKMLTIHYHILLTKLRSFFTHDLHTLGIRNYQIIDKSDRGEDTNLVEIGPRMVTPTFYWLSSSDVNDHTLLEV